MRGLPDDVAVELGAVRDLDLLRPIYQQTAAYGHFGREIPELLWENTDRAADLKNAAA